ncbi:putative non-specific serine/threonine protein kinase [Helianthus debilis subsp. tardiflorus]
MENLTEDFPHFGTAAEGAPVTVLKLLDTGNAVLMNVVSGSPLWQSFENPTDTFLPGMKMDQKINLTSWKSVSDPAPGSFKFQLEQDESHYSIFEGSMTYHWKSGKMSTSSFDNNQIPSNVFNLLSNNTKQIPENVFRNGTKSYQNFTFPTVDSNSRLVMNHSGKVQYFSWSYVKSQWVSEWEEPKDACSIDKVCGPFGTCKENNNTSLCSCLPGYEPNSPDDHRQGCRRTSNTCDKRTDTFINMTMISMDDPTVRFFDSDKESGCVTECLNNCGCWAYSYSSQNKGGRQDPDPENKPGCWFWGSELYNVRGKGTHRISFHVSGSSNGAFFALQLVALIA